MNKKTYWKDVRQSFSNSKGRVISIASLMALGSFALVGLKVTTPDMHQTGEHFFREHRTADLAVISDYGLNASDQKLLQTLDKQADVEYGYFKDVVIKDSSTAFRIFSKPEKVSTYDLAEGKLPQKRGEIALSAAYEGDYKIGDTIRFTEKESANGKMVLKDHSYTITGFVNSSEILSRVNLGRSTAGSGELSGYAIVTEDSFDSDVYMIARLAYDDLRSLSPYSQDYIDQVYDEKKAVQDLLAGEPEKRLAQIKSDSQSQIKKGENTLQAAIDQLKQGESQLRDGKEAIASGENQLAAARSQITSGENQLASASQQLAGGQAQLQASAGQLASGQDQLAAGYGSLQDNQNRLDAAKGQLDTSNSQLQEARSQLDAAASQISDKESQLSAAKGQLDKSQNQLSSARSQLDAGQAQLQTGWDQLATARTQAEALTDPDQQAAALAQLAQEEAQLSASQAQLQAQESQYQAGLAAYQAGLADYQAGASQLEAAKDQLAQKEADYQAGLSQYNQGLAQYQDGLAQLNSASSLLAQKQAEYDAGLAQYQNGLATYQEKESQYQAGLSQLNTAKATLSQKEAELAQAEATLAQKQQEYDQAKSKADPEIAQKKEELKEAQERVDQLSLPSYNVFTRREVPGSEGYISYENNASIISNVGNIFPIVLYFIAALVTFVTMARFVEEERIKAGTFKALGYENKDTVRKFVIYGLVTSMVGTAVGVTAGHLLLPNIIYNTYSSKIVLSPLEYHFYLDKTIYAIILALVSAVLPAFVVAKKELTEKPAQLLLPKPPTAGSKILMERISPLWSRMSFTQKVTARNIFRYKQRMLMTIFGVCGSIALLFAGLGIRSSIADLNNRQFTDIIRYDMIVAEKGNLTDKENQEIDKLLASKDIKEHLTVHYETTSKVAGSKKDQQEITTLALPKKDAANFKNYIQLRDRKTGQALTVDSDGVILSEKLAQLLDAKVGDPITVQDSNGKDIQLKVAGITEMYMSHFIFMSDETYEEAFGKVATDNAQLIRLKDGSVRKTDTMAADFMDLEGVQGVVQNTILKSQVETIVNSLSRVMMVLIGTSILLAIVVLYNLTNINVAERIRELSTIKVLGFHNKEVTLYIYRETIYLSLIGILVGFGLGLGLHAYMVAIIPPDTVMFNPAVGWIIYAIPAAVVVLILIALGFIVNRRLKHVDMLEALKSVE